MTDEPALMRRLVEGTWVSVKGLKPKHLSSDFVELLDLCIDTDQGWIDIKSKDRGDIDPWDELHSLHLHGKLEQSRHWWTPGAGWEVVDLMEAWRGTVFERLSKPPRHIRYFTRDRYKLARKPAETILDECEAIEISTDRTPNSPKLVIGVDTFIVGIVKAAIGERERMGLLRELTEFYPRP